MFADEELHRYAVENIDQADPLWPRAPKVGAHLKNQLNVVLSRIGKLAFSHPKVGSHLEN
jgi:hypothetical protein